MIVTVTSLESNILHLTDFESRPIWSGPEAPGLAQKSGAAYVADGVPAAVSCSVGFCYKKLFRGTVSSHSQQ